MHGRRNVILSRVLTVISWYSARKSRKQLHQLVQAALTAKPTVLAIVSDHYTNQDNLRPFAPVAERLGDRVHFILVAEYDQKDREREGEIVLRQLGLAPEARRRLLRDEGQGRLAVVLREKIPVALIELYFRERAYTLLDGRPDPEADKVRAREDRVVEQLEDLLGKLPPPAPPPSRPLAPGEHDFTERGICNFCGQGRSSLLACSGTRKDDGPKRDRFELIELD